MIKKVRLVIILMLIVMCFGAQAYGIQSEGARVVLTILSFNTDSAEIKSQFENELKKILAALLADPAMGLRIEGYGHQQGTPLKSREVSQKRLQAVKQWFLKHGVEENRLMAKNFADAKPAMQKGGTEDPAHSERVEILRVSLKQPLAFLPDARYQFEPVVEGQEVVHDFIVLNKGSAPLEIQTVKTD